ncbi:MAG TPA: M1 family aminopeptidase [Candidatus Binatus sp.]|nr:M1 family aminopeptidase [Candidatus Binatus sp.]
MAHFTILILLAPVLLAALFRHAECDYTSCMRPGVALFVLLCLIAPPVYSADQSPHEFYDALNALRLDPASTYQLVTANRIELRRGDVEIYFEEGKLAFLAPIDGRVTGFVFSGRGHALAFPRDVVEKQQMAHFLGAPVLDQVFITAYVRFTDDAADDLLHQFQTAKLAPQSDAAFASLSDPLVAQLNAPQSLRILEDRLSQNPKPYFYAALEGVDTGPFDFIFDPQRREQVLFGQNRKSGNAMYYDVWASYSVPGSAPSPVAFHALDYTLDTTVLPDNSLDATAAVHVRAEISGERVLTFQLSRALHAETVTGDQNKPLAYFQNEGMTPQERSVRGNDYLHVVLPQPSQKGQEFTIRFHYRGNVIENAGNEVLFVGARESWYPHLGDQAEFASYDLTMRWPRHLKLVATGAKFDEQIAGDFRVGRWRSDKPLSIAGFNLGEYASSSITSESRTIDVYANRQLEQALSNRLDSASPDSLPPVNIPYGLPGGRSREAMRPAPPSPADALKQLGKDIDSSIRFYEKFGGPFPFRTLSVSQIPGSFGQGWPGLLYISTFSFLSPEEQNRAGLSPAHQEAFTDIVPYHEVAHQWWGNVVGWSSYRDQWIDEAIANYLALLFADSRKPSGHELRVWLERYRKQLEEKVSGSDTPVGEIGALPLGNRLNSSKSPFGFEELIYSKGSWVMHMLREMLRQPGAKDPDAKFVAFLRNISTKYAYRALSTEDLQHEVEAVMTPAMDLEGGRSMEWFFEQWVRGTGIPHYRVEFSTHHTDKGEVVRGKLFQTGVPRSFIASVPLYANNGSGHNAFLGAVVAAGPETSFHFVTQAPPHKLVIDPQMTLLCTTSQTEKSEE